MFLFFLLRMGSRKSRTNGKYNFDFGTMVLNNFNSKNTKATGIIHAIVLVTIADSDGKK